MRKYDIFFPCKSLQFPTFLRAHPPFGELGSRSQTRKTVRRWKFWEFEGTIIRKKWIVITSNPGQYTDEAYANQGCFFMCQLNIVVFFIQHLQTIVDLNALDIDNELIQNWNCLKILQLEIFHIHYRRETVHRKEILWVKASEGTSMPCENRRHHEPGMGKITMKVLCYEIYAFCWKVGWFVGWAQSN